MLKEQENGRSMVEMLGVLAVIGVLSVAGIAGYTSAMNKHRANTLLNEAAKRAILCAGQITMNGHEPSISEFGNNEELGFDSTVYGENGSDPWTTTDKKFTLSIMGVSEAVCNQMKNAAGATIKDFKPTTCVSENENNVMLTFNNDMSTETIVTNNPTCESDFCYCPDGRASCDGICCASNEICTSTRPKIAKEYTCMLLDSSCQQTAEGCKDNEGVHSDQFCRLVATDNISISISSCQPKGSLDSIEYNGHTIYISDKASLNYWTSQNVCHSHGKKLITLGTLGLTEDYEYTATAVSCSCYDIENGGYITTSTEEKCDELGGIPEECEYASAGDLYQGLSEKVPDGYYWTNNTKSSARAYRVYFSEAQEGVKSDYLFEAGGRVVLCED